MVPAGNKAKRLSWVNHTTKTIQFRRYFHCYCIEFYECFTFESKAFPNCFKISTAKEITRCSISISVSQVVASIFVKENLMTVILVQSQVISFKIRASFTLTVYSTVYHPFFSSHMFIQNGIFSFKYCFTLARQYFESLSVSRSVFSRVFNSFMTEIFIMQKPVH